MSHRDPGTWHIPVHHNTVAWVIGGLAGGAVIAAMVAVWLVLGEHRNGDVETVTPSTTVECYPFCEPTSAGGAR